MPRTKKRGRPKLPKDKQKHTMSVRLTDDERLRLEVEFGTVQKAIESVLKKV